MSEIIMMIFTGVIAISTLIYTIFSIRLWKTTKNSVDIARYNSFMNLMTQLVQYTEDAKNNGNTDVLLIEQFTTMLAEYGVEQFLEDRNIKTDKNAIEYFSKIEAMLRAHNIDPFQVPWYRPILNKLKSK